MKSKRAPAEGIEPSTTRLKVVRSTTELGGLLMYFVALAHEKGWNVPL